MTRAAQREGGHGIPLNSRTVTSSDRLENRLAALQTEKMYSPRGVRTLISHFVVERVCEESTADGWPISTLLFCPVPKSPAPEPRRRF